jgi:50S ribosomal subunit-associated GTPase HflX
MVVKESDLQELASKYDAKAFLTSAKTGQNVESLFEALGLAVSEKMG